MTPIELRPRTGGPAITGTWNARGLLYLMGQGGALQWSADAAEDALPLAVAFKSQNTVVIAPVHPLCRVENGPATVRLGTEVFDVHMIVPPWRRFAKIAAIVSVMIFMLACGWWLHGFATSVSPVVAQSQEDLYVF